MVTYLFLSSVVIPHGRYGHTPGKVKLWQKGNQLCWCTFVTRESRPIVSIEFKVEPCCGIHRCKLGVLGSHSHSNCHVAQIMGTMDMEFYLNSTPESCPRNNLLFCKCALPSMLSEQVFTLLACESLTGLFTHVTSFSSCKEGCIINSFRDDDTHQHATQNVRHVQEIAI